MGIEDEVCGSVLCDHLKAVVLRRLQDFDHRLINDVPNRLSILGRLSLDHVDPCEWHFGVPSPVRLRAHGAITIGLERPGTGKVPFRLPIYGQLPMMSSRVALGIIGSCEHLIAGEPMAWMRWPRDTIVGVGAGTPAASRTAAQAMRKLMPSYLGSAPNSNDVTCLRTVRRDNASSAPKTRAKRRSACAQSGFAFLTRAAPAVVSVMRRGRLSSSETPIASKPRFSSRRRRCPSDDRALTRRSWCSWRVLGP